MIEKEVKKETRSKEEIIESILKLQNEISGRF